MAEVAILVVVKVQAIVVVYTSAMKCNNISGENENSSDDSKNIDKKMEVLRLING